MRKAIFSKSQSQDMEEVSQVAERESPSRTSARDELQILPKVSETTIQSARPTDGPPLITAVREGNLKEAERLVDENASLEDNDSNRATPLIVAARKGHTDTFGYSLDRGADPEATDSNGMNALEWATENEHSEIVDLILGPSKREDHDVGQQTTESRPTPTEPPPISTATVAEKCTNAYAIAGLILGGLSVFLYAVGIIPILAVVLSGVGLYKVKGFHGKGRVPAWIGLVLGIIYTIMY